MVGGWVGGHFTKYLRKNGTISDSLCWGMDKIGGVSTRFLPIGRVATDLFMLLYTDTFDALV